MKNLCATCWGQKTANTPKNWSQIWRQISIQPFLWAIQFYRLVFSPFVGYHCRHHPTCSVYAAQALKTHGLLKGLALAAWRVARCGPFGTSGVDCVPTAEAKPCLKQAQPTAKN